MKKNKKQRVASLNRSNKRVKRAIESSKLKSFRRTMLEKAVSEMKYKQELYLNKLIDSRFLGEK